MSMDSVASTLQFEPDDPGFISDPHPVLQRFREQAPIYPWPAAQGTIFFRHRDIQALLRDPRLITDATLGGGYSQELREKYPDFVALRENDLFMVSPEAHARIRKLVNPLFTPRALEGHRKQIEALLVRQVDALPREGTLNAYADFARTYPVRVIAGLLGIPEGDEATFVGLADALIATIFPGLSPEAFASYMPPISRGVALVRACIAERRAHPHGGDLLGALIDSCDEDARLSDGELLSLVAGILIGGSDTTVHLTTYTLHELLRHPDQLAILRAEPGLARAALDETLRYNSFGRGGGLVRFPKETFEYSGFELKRGHPVFLNLMSGLRDPEFVADADVYDIRRRVHSSPWFGYGAHFCLGASLARIEAELALQLFIARYPRIELAGPAVYGDHPVLRDIVDLPLRVSQA